MEIYIHWIISWFYIVLATIMSLYVTIHTKSKFQRQEVLPYFYFAIAPIIESIIQMYYPSSASFQVGITVSYCPSQFRSTRIKKIKQELTQEFQKLDMPYSLTVSIGYSCGNVYSEETIKKFFQEADKNMYKQKN